MVGHSKYGLRSAAVLGETESKAAASGAGSGSVQQAPTSNAQQRSVVISATGEQVQAQALPHAENAENGAAEYARIVQSCLNSVQDSESSESDAEDSQSARARRIVHVAFSADVKQVDGLIVALNSLVQNLDVPRRTGKTKTGKQTVSLQTLPLCVHVFLLPAEQKFVRNALQCAFEDDISFFEAKTSKKAKTSLSPSAQTEAPPPVPFVALVNPTNSETGTNLPGTRRGEAAEVRDMLELSEFGDGSLASSGSYQGKVLDSVRDLPREKSDLDRLSEKLLGEEHEDGDVGGGISSTEIDEKNQKIERHQNQNAHEAETSQQIKSTKAVNFATNRERVPVVFHTLDLKKSGRHARRANNGSNGRASSVDPDAGDLDLDLDLAALSRSGFSKAMKLAGDIDASGGFLRDTGTLSAPHNFVRFRLADLLPGNCVRNDADGFINANGARAPDGDVQPERFYTNGCVRRVLYLDVDVVVKADIREIEWDLSSSRRETETQASFGTTMSMSATRQELATSSATVCAALRPSSPLFTYVAGLLQPHVPHWLPMYSPAFNAGVLFLDLERWRARRWKLHSQLSYWTSVRDGGVSASLPVTWLDPRRDGENGTGENQSSVSRNTNANTNTWNSIIEPFVTNRTVHTLKLRISLVYKGV